MGMRLWVLGFIVGLLIAGANAGQVQAKHAQVELLAQQTTLREGHENLLGVHFILEQGWHIYWINPGDSGQPPVFQWQLPEGFSAGPMQWPRPEKLQSAHLMDYGYKDDVMLLVPVHVPASYKVGTQVTLAVQAKWLICREVCIPDHAQLETTLSSNTPAVDQNHARLFAETKKLLPRRWPPAWKIWAISKKDSFELSVRTGKPVTDAEFFPMEANQIENSTPQFLQPMGGGTNIILAKSDQLLKPISKLKGLLALGNQVYEIEAPVTQH